MFKVRDLLDHVAKGKQDEANAILESSDDFQALIRAPGKFTDYSGRTFKCTAYEYAYWAKDTHMQRMLEHYMDDETKAFLLGKIDELERSGLAYQQHGVAYQNAHYDMSFILKNLNAEEFCQLKTIVGQTSPKIQQATIDNYQHISFTAKEYETVKKIVEQNRPKGIFSFFYASPVTAIDEKLQFDFHSLITALDAYVVHYDVLNAHEREEAWMKVGKAQRDVPAHVAQEYCRMDWLFDPLPSFQEEILPRVLAISNYVTNIKSWFPLTASNAGLGFDFALIHGAAGVASPGVASWTTTARKARHADLAAVSRLDEVRTLDLTRSREYLTPPALSQSMSSY